MRKTLATLLSAAMIGCASPERTEPQPLLPGERVLAPVVPDTAELTLTFFDQLLNASDVSEHNRQGHVTNLLTLEAAIAKDKKITSSMPANEQLRAIHQYLFDHNAHRYAREVSAEQLFTLAQPHRIIAYDLQKGARPVGSELGLALELFVLAGRFGHQVTPYIITRNRERHLIFVSDGQLIDATDPFGVRDAPDVLGEQLTPANLIGLYLTAKGTAQVVEGKLEVSAETLQRAYNLYPSFDVAMNLGVNAILRAQELCQQAQTDPQRRIEHQSRAEFSLLRAREWYEQAITLDPRNPIPHERLGDLSARQLDYQTAKTHYWNALEFDASSRNAHLYAKYGETLVMLNRKDEAQPFFRRALELEPNNESLRAGIEQYRDACKTR